MKFEYINSTSTVEPSILDNTSSPNVVYVRKNIVPREEEQEDGSVITYYDYQEAKISKADWDYFKSIIDLDSKVAKSLADIDYIAMEIGVDLDAEVSEEVDNE